MNSRGSVILHFLWVIFCFFMNMEEQKCANIDFKKDSAKIKDLLNTAQDNSTSDFNKALSQAKSALGLVEKLHDNKLLFCAYRTLGIIYEDNNRLTEAYTWYEKALAMQEDIPTASKLDVYLDWAIINKKLSKYEITREYYQRSLDLANQTNDMEIVEYVYTGLGTFYGSVGEFDKAIEFHLRSKEIAEKRNHTEGVIFAQVNISTVYVQSKNYKSAYSFLQKGYDLVVNTNDSIQLDYVLNAYGQVLNAEKKYPEALAYHQNALKYCQKTGDKWMIARTLGFMADVYTKMAQYPNAVNAFNLCFKYSSYFDFYEQPNLYLSLGNLYVKTKKQNEAINAFQKSLDMSSKRGFKDLIQKNNLGLAEVYEQIGNYDAALKHLQIAEMYDDSIFNEDKFHKIAEVQYKYNTEKTEIEYKVNLEKSEKEIQALQLSQNRVFLYLLSIAVFALFSSIFAFYFIRQKNKNNTLLSQKNREIELKNDRLEKSNEILKQFAYASAHDLKEPLRSINSFVSIINKRYAHLLPPEASEYMNFVIIGGKRMESLISALLEYSTVASDEDEVKQSTSIAEVLKEITNNLYSSISEKNAIVETNGYLPKVKISRLHLTQLFQNLISNAIKFNDKKPVVEIIGKVQNGQYVIEVRDNGIGMKLEYSDKIYRLFQRLSCSTQYDGIGIGLAICKQIVDKYEGTIRFESIEKEGTTFIVSFPLALIDKEQALNEPEKVDNKKSNNLAPKAGVLLENC